eukprot:723878-Amphidinium_carterae.1
MYAPRPACVAKKRNSYIQQHIVTIAHTYGTASAAVAGSSPHPEPETRFALCESGTAIDNVI